MFGAGVENSGEQGLIRTCVILEKSLLVGVFKNFLDIKEPNTLDVDGAASFVDLVIAVGVTLPELDDFGEVKFLSKQISTKALSMSFLILQSMNFLHIFSVSTLLNLRALRKRSR